MVIDTSALLAVLFIEPERPELVRKLAAARRRLISSATLIEASIVVEARRCEAAGRERDLFLHRAKVQVVAPDEEQAQLARGVAPLRQGQPSGRPELRRPVRLRSRGRPATSCCSRARTWVAVKNMAPTDK